MVEKYKLMKEKHKKCMVGSIKQLKQEKGDWLNKKLCDRYEWNYYPNIIKYSTFRAILQNWVLQKPSLENFAILREFRDVFPKKFSSLPPKWDINFTIYLIPISTLISKEAYKMIILKLTELRMHLQELLDKKYT